MTETRIDVMLDGRYQATLTYRHSALAPIKETRLRRFVEHRLPTLRGKSFRVFFVAQND